MENPEIEDYILNHSSLESSILKKLYRETYLKVPYARMASGHIQGSLLKMISCMISPERILEIGAFTGYSALCLAEGLKPEGTMDTIEVNPELEEIIRKYIALAGFEKKIHLRIGKALEIIPLLADTYDLVFIDADKENYPEYYRQIFQKVRIGGFILADNVLWDGKVALAHPPDNKETRGIIEFNDIVSSDIRTEKIILPIRDGISIIRKISD
jgi:caffeoyl-CoA O-methyltransferase